MDCQYLGNSDKEKGRPVNRTALIKKLSLKSANITSQLLSQLLQAHQQQQPHRQVQQQQRQQQVQQQRQQQVQRLLQQRQQLLLVLLWRLLLLLELLQPLSKRPNRAKRQEREI
jgi:hypothetical protein